MNTRTLRRRAGAAGGRTHGDAHGVTCTLCRWELWSNDLGFMAVLALGHVEDAHPGFPASVILRDAR